MIDHVDIETAFQLDREAGTHALGIDIGSSYTKFIIVDGNGGLPYRKTIPTLSRRQEQLHTAIEEIRSSFALASVCTTGYGRNAFDKALKKTELICASVGLSHHFPHEKWIIDIGGEDLKLIESGPAGEVRSFFMNDKCAAGTGSFITEIADKAELGIEEMSDLARRSSSQKAMNSFCTVFAKTEILGWKFNGVPIEDIARGIYLSIVKRVIKLPMREKKPVYLCGGVIAYHPFICDLLSKELDAETIIAPSPQYMVALGAALLARKQSLQQPSFS